VEAPDRRYRYTGKEKDEETALYYHGARYYACWLGRWTAPDPSGLVDGPNRYAYVGNSPISKADPTGRTEVGGLTVSPSSRISAKEWVDMIQRSPRMAQWMKDVFVAKGNTIVLNLKRIPGSNPPEFGIPLPPGLSTSVIPAWFTSAVTAIKEKEWHLTTAVSIVSDKSTDLDKKFIIDTEAGDAPGHPPSVTTGSIFTGETIGSDSKLGGFRSNITGSGIGRKMFDDQAGDKGGLRRGVHGSTPAEGLIAVATRYRDLPNGGLDVRRSEEAMLESLFHELAAHAGQITQQLPDSHGLGDYRVTPITPADFLANAVFLFFGSPDETSTRKYARDIGPTGTAELLKQLDDMVKQLRPLIQQFEQAQAQLRQRQPAPAKKK
jgi:RHS repeat-associated protein